MTDEDKLAEYHYYHDRIAEFVGMLGADFPYALDEGMQASFRIMNYLKTHEGRTISAASLMGLLLCADMILEKMTDRKANPYPEVDQ